MVKAARAGCAGSPQVEVLTRDLFVVIAAVPERS
jgi:hypothetical protein